MSDWEILAVARPGQQAANEPWPQYAPRRHVSITRLGPYTRVILSTTEDQTPALAKPEWA